ncbi:hypothetical protein CKO16_04800 [Rhodoblastus acidophilus]|nr:hypothetical protein CKO16_04800 [Rhodoblastus acidophilus]
MGATMTTTVNTDTRFDDPLDEFWREPLPSVASRKFSMKARRTGRSTIPAIVGIPRYVRKVQCESLLESNCAIVLLARRDVINLVEQLPPVAYFDEVEQKWKKHHFDFLAQLTDGSRIAIAVRSAARAQEVRAVVEAIAAQGCALADGYAVVTDADLPINLVRNSELILAVRRDHDRSADEKIRDIVTTLHGTTTIEMLVAASGLEGKGFRAVVRMIDEGELEIARDTLIDYPATVRRPATGRAAA